MWGLGSFRATSVKLEHLSYSGITRNLNAEHKLTMLQSTKYHGAAKACVVSRIYKAARLKVARSRKYLPGNARLRPKLEHFVNNCLVTAACRDIYLCFCRREDARCEVAEKNVRRRDERSESGGAGGKTYLPQCRARMVLPSQICHWLSFG